MSDVVRLRSGEKFPLYKIEEAVYQGKTDVMSCTVVHTGENDEGCVVVHVDPQPISTVPKEGFQLQIALSIKSTLPEELFDTLFVRYRDNLESFPIAESGKRNITALIHESIENAQKR